MYEHRDEAVAARLARGVSPTADDRAGVTTRQQAVLRLQREAGNAAVTGLLEDERSPVLDVVGSGGGRPLDPAARAAMETHLGGDFGGVRVHTGEAAAASARSVQAQAYTVGDDVILSDGVDPTSTTGQRTLAHELTHVVQQRAGEVDGTSAAGGIRVSDPGDRFEQEAERVADRVTSGPTEAQAVSAAGPGVQRQEAMTEDENEEEDVQTLPLQRQEEDDTRDETAE